MMDVETIVVNVYIVCGHDSSRRFFLQNSCCSQCSVVKHNLMS